MSVLKNGALEGRLTLDAQVCQVRADLRCSDPQGAALNTRPHQLRSEAEEEGFLTLAFADHAKGRRARLATGRRHDLTGRRLSLRFLLRRP